MQVITVAGPPSCGKTSVLLHAIAQLHESGMRVGAVKFDCLTAEDRTRYEEKGVEVLVGLSAGQCPDHFYISNLPEAVRWASDKELDMLISESAGLCNRCSPHLKELRAVCVIDYISGIRAPQKVGPMLKTADFIVLTKGDLVSQAEREVFALQVSMLNPRAQIAEVNGITGQGIWALCQFLKEAGTVDTVEEFSLRYPMPSALCSYCLGETKVGEAYQLGNIRKMEIGGA